MTPQTVNAYYNASMNEIVFPAAILQPPFFDMAADDAVNYGAIGAVIGHELSHGFDDQGRKSDGDGNLRDWWSQEDANQFKARAERLVSQYRAFEPLPGQKVNGELTLGENIGDLGGLTIAYRAYRLSLAGRRVPGDRRAPPARSASSWAGPRSGGASTARPSCAAAWSPTPTPPPNTACWAWWPTCPNITRPSALKPGDKAFLPEDERVKIW